jgi:hypothetical protein
MAVVTKMEAMYSPKRLYLPASPHGVTTQKTNIGIFTAVKTSDGILSYKNLQKLCEDSKPVELIR